MLSLEPLRVAQHELLLRGLREAGWQDGRLIEVVLRDAQGHAARLPALDAAARLPVVFFCMGDPIGTGLVADLARPGGRATGFGGIGPEMHAKMGQLLHEAAPKARRIGVPFNP